MSVLLIGVAICVVAALFFGSFTHPNKEKKLPGPWSPPIVGHFFFMGKNPLKTLSKWKKIHGPIYSAKIGSIPVLFLNDVKLIKEAFCLRSFSGRPLLKNFEEMSQRKGIAFNDGPEQEEQRTFAMKTFKDFGISKLRLEARIQEEIAVFIKSRLSQYQKLGILEHGIKVKVQHFFQFAIINSIWTGITGETFDESNITTQEFLNSAFVITDAGRNLVVQMSWYFPWIASLLSYYGLNKFVNGWRNVQKFIARLLTVKRNGHIPGAPKHFTDAYFDKVDNTKNSDSSFHNAKSVQEITTTDLFNAIIEPTTLTMDWMLLYLAKNQNIQQKLLHEIDSVKMQVGASDKGFSIGLAARCRMPYTEAIIHELLRVTSVAPFGVFHRTIEDVIFHGYFVPKNTMVIGNQYVVHHDGDIWQDPDEFIPERFVNSEGRICKVMLEKLIPFSTGKRRCLGEDVARDLLFLMIANFFLHFEVKCTTNVPSSEGIYGLLRSPDVFEIYVFQRGVFKHDSEQ